MGLGTSGHFAQVLSRLGRTVTYRTVTLSENSITGDQQKTYGGGVSKTWIFFKHQQKFHYDKEGLIEMGDAYVLIPSTDTINLYDRVTVDNETYEVTNVGDKGFMIRHLEGSSIVYIYAVLDKVLGDQQ